MQPFKKHKSDPAKEPPTARSAKKRKSKMILSMEDSVARTILTIGLPLVLAYA
uniref:Uncharacterized protein n=1 Tax=Lotus japonicus TaxID=34305 RepID=I3TA25_LOTJA|nr:unknown [Lotus japonicus]